MKVTGTISAFLLYQFISKNYGAKGVGIYSLFNVMISLLAILCALGMASSTMQLIPKFLSKLEYFNLKRLALYHFIISGSLSVVISIIIYINSSYLTELMFQSGSNASLIRYVAIFLPFYTMSLIGNHFIRGLSFIKLFEYFRSTHVQLFGLICLVVFTTLCNSNCYFENFLKFIRPIEIPVVITGALIVLSCILSWLVVFNFLLLLKNKKSKIQEKILTIKNTLSISLPMLASAFSAIIMDRVDSLMLAYFYSNTEVGLYNVANKLATLILFLIIPLISSVLTKISTAYWAEDKVNFNNLIDKTLKIMFWSSILIYSVLVLFSDFLLGLFGDEFINSKVTLIILSTGFLFNAMLGLVEHLMNLTGNQRRLSIIFSIGVIINICLNYFLIPKYGIEGAAFSTMISMVFWNIAAAFFCTKHILRRVFYLPFIK